MRNACRPMGRFFCLLKLLAAVVGMATAVAAQTNGPELTRVVDTVYCANGTAGAGTVIISWPAFTTSDGKVVAAGSFSVHLGSGGSFAASLAPNTGAQPAGVFYKVVYQLVSQEPSTEYWVVPATGSTTIGAVRAKLQPQTVAAQVLTRDVADTNYVHVQGDQTLKGAVTFAIPPTIPTPQNPSDAANRAYVDSTEAALMASPGPIGSGTPDAAIFTSVNKVINPTTYPGVDIGAQVNAAIAANHCSYGQNICVVELPAGLYSYATTITIPFGVTLRCAGQTTDFINGTLNYTGTGTAVALTGSTSQLRNCGITAPHASVVLDNSGQSTTVDSVYFSGYSGGGFAGTIIRAHGNKQVYTNIQAEFFKGIGFQCDHAIDVYLDKFNFYGSQGNHTGISLLLETGCAGIHVNQFSGGTSGLHGLVVRNTLGGGGTPIQMFFNDFVADCSFSDGWYFDPALGAYELDAHFVNSWAAGAGINCSDGSTLQPHKAGVRISGGSAINISNSMIRANSGSGVVIDSAAGGNSSGIVIGDSQILSNNRNSDGTESGIDVEQVVKGLVIHDNTITNSLEGGTGHQRYGINIASNSTYVNVSANDIFDNVIAATNYAAGVTFGPLTVGALTIGGNTVIDSSRNATVQNLTVNGACVGCGGGSGGDLASPPAIGSVTPNAATFTKINNVLMADAQAGADACGKINASIGQLDSTLGGTVDARGFNATQLAATCSATITIDRPVRLLLPNGKLKLGGCPGINVAVQAGVEIVGTAWDYRYPTAGTQGAILQSGANCFLIADSAGSQGTIVRNVDLDGNNAGTIGYFGPMTGGGVFENVRFRTFTRAGGFFGGLLNHFKSINASANAGDGLFVGADSVIEGNTELVGNGATGLHVIAGGTRITDPNVADNGLHNIWFDGGTLQTSRPNTTQIVQPYAIRPSSGNSGNYYFYAANVGGTTGASTPIWCQTQGCTVTDGTVTWYNVNKLGSITIPAAENMWLLNAYVGDAGNATISTFPNFQASNVRIDGQLTTTPYCNSNHIVGLHIQQGYFLNAKTDGLHITNCENQSITNAYIGGESYNPASATPDRGGLILDGVYTSTFSDLNFEYNTRSAIQLINATQSNAFSNVHINNSVGDAISSPYNYGLYMDGTSFSNSFSNLFIQGNSTNAHGIYGSAGPSNFVHNYVPSGTNAGTLTFDTLGAVVLTNASGRQANVPVEFDVNGASALAIDSTGKVMVGELSVRDIPGHEYFVSKFANIQAAIDAAYNNGTVQGGATVIDDRLAPYSGAGFIVKDSVTLKLAATTYTITGTVTYNNGVGNVTAGIISMPGSHIVGVGTSSNHGTIVSAGAGLSADLIASSTLGTGTGTNAQWWHWGSIESLNINGASQASGRCLVVENMGETARVENILARSCYGNNIEIIGSSASQSSIRNITTMRSQTASGMRFTNLSGVGKVDGLSGDCNPTSLVSVQENAAGSLTILGLKAEGEASICTGTVHDPVVLLDGVAGFNDHVRIIGGYAFGTAQGSFAKFVNTGNAILETEGLYITGYTNMLNDTVRGVTVPLSSSMSKQPFYYEPGGTTYANQAFTLTGGTFVQGQPATTPTEIFGLTTGSATLLAAAGNGDNSSILTGGIQISGQNRAQYGTPPEIMARWGYRWLGAGLGYDTTNFDLVPAWNSGDTSSRNLGNSLTVCKKGSTTVSCRWPNIYALNVDTMSLTLNGSAVTIPTAGATTPNMDGTGAAGSSGNYARADHVHPTDVSRVATASVTAYGSCGDSTHVCQMTTNSQGLVTNESAVAIAAGAASIPYWSNQVAAGGSIAMSGAANKVYCYGIRIDQPITVTSVGMFVGTGDGTGNYSVQIFPPGSNQLPVFSSTAVHVSAAAGAEQQFSQPGNATWAATPGIYQMCTTGSAVTATMKGSASPMWNYYSQPSGLTSSGGLISGTLSSAVAPTFLNTAPTVVMH